MARRRDDIAVLTESIRTRETTFLLELWSERPELHDGSYDRSNKKTRLHEEIAAAMRNEFCYDDETIIWTASKSLCL